MRCLKRASGPTWFCTTAVTIFSLWNSPCVTNPTHKKLDCTQNKYVNISQNLTPKFSICAVELYTMEVSVLGFQSDLSEFCTAARLPVLPEYIKISKVAINSSYNIYIDLETLLIKFTILGMNWTFQFGAGTILFNSWYEPAVHIMYEWTVSFLYCNLFIYLRCN